MTRMIVSFLKDKGGAISIDWVVVTAAVLAVSLVVMTGISDGAEMLSTSTATTMVTTRF